MLKSLGQSSIWLLSVLLFVQQIIIHVIVSGLTCKGGTGARIHFYCVDAEDPRVKARLCTFFFAFHLSTRQETTYVLLNAVYPHKKLIITCTFASNKNHDKNSPCSKLISSLSGCLQSVLKALYQNSDRVTETDCDESNSYFSQVNFNWIPLYAMTCQLLGAKPWPHWIYEQVWETDLRYVFSFFVGLLWRIPWNWCSVSPRVIQMKLTV